MPSEEYWERMISKFMEEEGISEDDRSDLDLSDPDPYTEEDLLELERQYKG